MYMYKGRAVCSFLCGVSWGRVCGWSCQEACQPLSLLYGGWLVVRVVEDFLSSFILVQEGLLVDWGQIFLAPQVLFYV